ncbi:MAG: pyridoxamine 5'-phosphate oxidase family protein [Bacteroidales bacterium]|nr:pyridoxamine 5'-phosphate oxidase family protein [Bacteroidales bacterium]
MDFDNSRIRRQDRVMEKEESSALLSKGEYGVLSMQDEDGDGGGYGIPVNYAWDNGKSIYIHCAPEGKKLRAIAKNNRVSFCVVGETRVLPARFTTEFKSIILDCTADTGLPAAERLNALKLLIEKYSPGLLEKGLEYAEKSFDRTEIIRLDIKRWSGKCKKQVLPG